MLSLDSRQTREGFMRQLTCSREAVATRFAPMHSTCSHAVIEHGLTEFP